jgi:hypothetical protein
MDHSAASWRQSRVRRGETPAGCDITFSIVERMVFVWGTLHFVPEARTTEQQGEDLQFMPISLANFRLRWASVSAVLCLKSLAIS